MLNWGASTEATPIGISSPTDPNYAGSEIGVVVLTFPGTKIEVELLLTALASQSERRSGGRVALCLDKLIAELASYWRASTTRTAFVWSSW